jgi:PAS domain-containing protein
MNSQFAYTLMMRADAARKRLAELEEKHDATPRRTADAMKIALRELNDVLEELRTATEQLQAAMDDVVIARQQASAYQERYYQFQERLPLPCILTNEAGCVDEANSLAADLLNVAQRYLVGKPLFLFLPEREQYFRMVEIAKEKGSTAGRLLLRPREQKPRPVSVGVSMLPQQTRWCWLISESTD